MRNVVRLLSTLILMTAMLVMAGPRAGLAGSPGDSIEESAFWAPPVLLVGGDGLPRQTEPAGDTLPAGDPAGAANPAAPNAVGYYDGMIQYSGIVNCISIIQGMPYGEYGMGTYVGFAADPQAAVPGPGQKYYIHIVVAGLGNSCSGQRAWLEFGLPISTSLAISLATPVRCYFDGGAIPPAECPQSLPSSSYHPGAYAVPSVDSAHAYTWPVPQGHFIEIQIPVVSSTTLSGVQLAGYVWALDGNSSPWLAPTQGVYVFSSTPSVLYPSASTERIGSPVSGYKSTTWVYNHGLAGSVYFDLGKTAAYGEFTDGPAVIPPAGEPLSNAYTVWSDWTPHTLLPNTVYHWRARFVTASQTYYGSDQVFTTAADGQVKMGSGSAASCTPAALTTALGTPGIKTLTFDCGAEPVVLTLSGGWQVGSNFTMDGGNKVTLQGNNTFRLFDVINGGALYLKNLGMSGGATTVCGGGIHVSSGGSLDAANVRLTANQSTQNGGGLCVEAGGTASILGTLISGSSAVGSGGGIWNGGSLSVSQSDITANTSSANGGGIYNSGSLSIFHSLVSNNNAPTGATRSGVPVTGGGGGIFNTGILELTTSTVADNVSSFAGGVLNNAGSVWLTNVTIAGNRVQPGGKPLFFASQAGGLESSLGGSVTVRNTLIAGNQVPAQVSGTQLNANCGTSPSKTIVSMGNNLDGGSQCGFTQPSDQQNIDPLLGGLANNGGRTRTVALRRGSPAIDRAENMYCGMYDQRGFSGLTPPGDIVQRQLDGNNDGTAVCDIGAFEYRPMLFVPLVRR